MNINIETNTVQNVTSNELDVIARELCGVKLSLADSGVPTYQVQSVSTNGITALTSDGVYSDTQNALQNIGITVQTAITYQRILDPEVRRLLSTFFNGQEGLPINYTDVVNSSNTSFQTLFKNNTDIVNFDEFKYFSWYNNNGYFSFKGCSNLKSIDLSNTRNFPGGFINGCGSLEYFYGTGSTRGELIIPGNSIINSQSFDQLNTDGIKIYITKLIFQEGITQIPGMFIRSVSNLTEVSIPSTCSAIYSQAFYDCKNVQKVNISDLNAWVNISFSDASSNPTNSAASAKLYLNGQIVTDYTYPEGTTEVKNYTWCGNKGLESIYLPQTITSIGEYAFCNCTNLVISDLNLPNLTALGSFAFSGTKVQAASNLGNITSIGYRAFKGCSGLTSITIPNSVTSIGSYAFEGCSGLTSITIPNSVTSISSGAFYSCNALTTVVLGSGITKIKAFAFGNDIALRSLTVRAVNPPVCENNALGQSAIVGFYNNYCDIYVPAGSVDAYKTADGWSAAASRIQAIPE